MIKLIIKIGLVNIGLFILLFLTAIFVAFGMGYSSKSTYNKQLLILYSLTALVQVVINYLIYKKQITTDFRIFIVIIVLVIVLYTLYPFLMLL